MDEATGPTLRPLPEFEPPATTSCPAERSDGTPCWMLPHPGNTHMTREWEKFHLPATRVRHINPALLDPLRDAPHALRPAAGQKQDG